MQAKTEKLWRNRPLVRERDERRVRRLWRMLLGIVVAVAPMGFYLIQQNEYLQLTYTTSELRARQQELHELEQALRSQRAALESLSEVERWAKEEHGLCRPDPEQVMILGFPDRGPSNLVASTSAR